MPRSRTKSLVAGHVARQHAPFSNRSSRRPMRSSRLSSLAFVLLAAPYVSVSAQSATQAGRPLSAPVAARIPKADTLHGDVRIDNYAWLRDDARKRPEVISYLEAENAYTTAKT